jgi:hypothetical protein
MSGDEEEVQFHAQTFLTSYEPSKKAGAPPKKQSGTKNKRVEDFSLDDDYRDFLESLLRSYWPQYTLRKNKRYELKYSTSATKKVPR